MPSHTSSGWIVRHLTSSTMRMWTRLTLAITRKPPCRNMPSSLRFMRASHRACVLVSPTRIAASHSKILYIAVLCCNLSVLITHKFMSQHGQERSNIVHFARQTISELLGPDFKRMTFQTTFPGRESDPRLRGLLQNPMKPTEKYPFDMSMLFPLGNCMDLGHIFEVELLPRVSARIPSHNIC